MATTGQGVGLQDWDQVRWDALRKQNAEQRATILRQQEGLDQRDTRIAMLVGDNRRLRLALGHERPMLALVAPMDLEA